MERREDRTVPATVVWDGGGGDLNWNNPLNWFNVDTGNSSYLPTNSDDVFAAVAGPIPNRPVTTIRVTANAQAKTLDARDNIVIESGATLGVVNQANFYEDLQIANGTLVNPQFGGTAVHGLLTWDSGTILRGRVEARGGLQAVHTTGGGSRYLDARLVSFGAGVISGGDFGPAGINIAATGGFENSAGGVLDVSGTVFSESTGNAPVVTNKGTLRKAGAGRATLAARVENWSGAAIQVDAGELFVQANLNLGGAMTVAPGSRVSFSSLGNLSLNGSLTGDGEVSFQGGAHSFFGPGGGTGTYNVASTVLNQASFTVGPGQTAQTGRLYVNDGSIWGSGTLAVTAPAASDT
jgi:hypothetical protein